MKARILLIEDDPGAGTAFQKVLRAEGYAVDLVGRGEEGLSLAGQNNYDVILTDLKLPGLSGLDLVSRLRKSLPKMPIVLMTAHGTTETAIEAMKLGAFEYLTKPFEVEELLAVVTTAVDNSRKMSEVVELGGVASGRSALVGGSRVMQGLYKEIGRVAATSMTVLIRGATGTGKEMVARALYQHSDRVDRPFIAVNCGAIPQALLESELFGHERGAFTGAHAQRIGRFEQAQGGTLFLDEVGDLPVDTQAKLLRVLQEWSFHRVGGDRAITADVRVLAATHRDLETAIKEKEFREDLFYRLGVVTLRVPSLAERPEDIPELVKHFIQRHAADLGVTSPSIQAEAIEFLCRQRWLGNVRELENVVRQALVHARPFSIGVSHVEQAVSRSEGAVSHRDLTMASYAQHLLNQAEKGELEDVYWRMTNDVGAELIRQAIHRAQGNQAKAARWLGVTRLKLREGLTQLHMLSTPEDHPGVPDPMPPPRQQSKPSPQAGGD